MAQLIRILELDFSLDKRDDNIIVGSNNLGNNDRKVYDIRN